MESKRTTPQILQLSAVVSKSRNDGGNSAAVQVRGEKAQSMKLNFRTCMDAVLLAGHDFRGTPAAFSQISVGILIGSAAGAALYAVRPVCPGPEAEYAWVDGYWYR